MQHLINVGPSPASFLFNFIPLKLESSSGFELRLRNRMQACWPLDQDHNTLCNLTSLGRMLNKAVCYWWFPSNLHRSKLLILPLSRYHLITRFFKWAKPGLFLFNSFFSHDKYSTNLTINDKSIDGVLGTWTWGGRMLGANESSELWWHPQSPDNSYYLDKLCPKTTDRKSIEQIIQKLSSKI